MGKDDLLSPLLFNIVREKFMTLVQEPYGINILLYHKVHFSIVWWLIAKLLDLIIDCAILLRDLVVWKESQQ